jgi:hypothetical protein
MKKLLLIAVLFGGSWTLSSCSSSCTADLNAFSSAAQSYATAVASTNCAQINSAWSAYQNAYNDLCDDQKSPINWTANENNHAALIAALGC